MPEANTTWQLFRVERDAAGLIGTEQEATHRFLLLQQDGFDGSHRLSLRMEKTAGELAGQRVDLERELIGRRGVDGDEVVRA